MTEITREKVVEWLSSQSVLEISALVKELEEKWGVSAAAPVAIAAMPGVAPAAAAEEAEEKSEFNIVLTDVGANRINVIKVVRAHTNLGLKEAKEMVEAVPKVVKENVPKDEAAAIKKEFEEAGAKVELK